MKRESARVRVIGEVGPIIQAECGWAGPVSGQITAEAEEDFREHVEDLLESA